LELENLLRKLQFKKIIVEKNKELGGYIRVFWQSPGFKGTENGESAKT
jgi:hypothetical protein